jgi:hypothetical protein
MNDIFCGPETIERTYAIRTNGKLRATTTVANRLHTLPLLQSIVFNNSCMMQMGVQRLKDATVVKNIKESDNYSDVKYDSGPENNHRFSRSFHRLLLFHLHQLIWFCRQWIMNDATLM